MFTGLQIGCGLADLGCNWLDASRLEVPFRSVTRVQTKETVVSWSPG